MRGLGGVGGYTKQVHVINTEEVNKEKPYTSKYILKPNGYLGPWCAPVAASSVKADPYCTKTSERYLIYI